MSLGDFWLQFNNGKKQQLNNVNHGVRKEQLDSKFHSLFDAFDANSDGTLEESEIKTICNWFTKLAGDDKVLDSQENISAQSIFEYETTIKDADFQGFLESVSKAGEDVVSSTETITADGGKEIRTEYKDGTAETIVYYPDGSYKFKKIDRTETTRYYTIADDYDTKYSEEEIKSMVDKAYEKELAKYKQKLDAYNKDKTYYIEIGVMAPQKPDYNNFASEYMQKNNINPGHSTNEIHNLQFSERAKMDISVRQFFLEHFIETHQNAKDILATVGGIDKFLGKSVKEGAVDFFEFFYNTINNNPEYLRERLKDDDTIRDFNDLIKAFEPNYYKSQVEKLRMDAFNEHPEMYFSDFEKTYVQDSENPYNMEKVYEFENLAQKYQMITVLKYRIEKIQDAIEKLEHLNSANLNFKHSSGIEQSYYYDSQKNNAEINYNEAIAIIKDIFGEDTFAMEELMKYANYSEDITDFIDPNDPMYQMYGPDAFKCANPMDSELAKYKGLLKSLLEETQNAYNKTIQKEDFSIQSAGDGYLAVEITSNGEEWNYEDLKKAYQDMYKDIYGTNYTPDDVIDESIDAKMAGGMAKLAIITIVSILITKSPALASLSSAGAASEGVAANYIRTLIAKYGQTAVQQGIKFAMSTGTLATDAVLTLFNQITSERGYNGNEYWQSVGSSALYIYSGTYVGGPAAEAIAGRIKGIGLCSKLFKGGTSTVTGAIETTTISGEKCSQISA